MASTMLQRSQLPILALLWGKGCGSLRRGGGCRDPGGPPRPPSPGYGHCPAGAPDRAAKRLCGARAVIRRDDGGGFWLPDPCPGCPCAGGDRCSCHSECAARLGRWRLTPDPRSDAVYGRRTAARPKLLSLIKTPRKTPASATQPRASAVVPDALGPYVGHRIGLL